MTCLCFTVKRSREEVAVFFCKREKNRYQVVWLHNVLFLNFILHGMCYSDCCQIYFFTENRISMMIYSTALNAYNFCNNVVMKPTWHQQKGCSLSIFSLLHRGIYRLLLKFLAHQTAKTVRRSCLNLLWTCSAFGSTITHRTTRREDQTVPQKRHMNLHLR
jgi:hypothetical protein